MAADRVGPVVWAIGLVALFLAITGLFWPFLDDEPDVRRKTETDSYVDSVQVTSWDWRGDRTGAIFAVYGTVKNLGEQDLSQVVMHLRAEDQDGETVGRYTIIARDVKSGQEKPFREDVPRTGRESTGYLDVARVVR